MSNESSKHTPESDNENSSSATGSEAKQDAATASQGETGKILDEISRSTGNKSGVKPARRKRSGSGFFSLLIILLPLLAGLGWLAWQQMNLQQALVSASQQNQQLQQSLSAQAAEIEALRQRPEPLPAPDNSAEIAQLQESLGSEIRRLQQQLAAVQNRPAANAATPDFNWKIFEAEYLVETAARKLRLEYDLASAINLLEQADAALVAANHAGAFPVRQALADDLASLRASSSFDVEGVYLRIDALLSNVGQLDLLASMREDFEGRLNSNSTAVALDTSLGEDAPGWLESTLAFLGDVFVWREWDERPEAMLAPGQESLIKLNLRLLLEQAQLALLQRDEQQFASALNQTADWLRRYAVLDSANGRGIEAELNALLALDIDPPLPPLDASLNSIRTLAASER